MMFASNGGGGGCGVFAETLDCLARDGAGRGRQLLASFDGGAEGELAGVAHCGQGRSIDKLLHGDHKLTVKLLAQHFLLLCRLLQFFEGEVGAGARRCGLRQLQQDWFLEAGAWADLD